MGYLWEMFGGSLALTLGIELPIVYLLGMRRGRCIFLAALVNVLTNPPAVLLCWLGQAYLPNVPWLCVQAPVEIVAVWAEAFVYRSFAKSHEWDIPHPVLLSVAANLCSWLCGVIFF